MTLCLQRENLGFKNHRAYVDKLKLGKTPLGHPFIKHVECNCGFYANNTRNFRSIPTPLFRKWTRSYKYGKTAQKLFLLDLNRVKLAQHYLFNISNRQRHLLLCVSASIYIHNRIIYHFNKTSYSKNTAHPCIVIVFIGT